MRSSEVDAPSRGEVTVQQQAGHADEPEVIVGSGRHTYRLINYWAKLPEGWEYNDVAAVAVDAADRVYVAYRSDRLEHPIMIFDRDGTLLNRWGGGLFSKRLHGIHVGPDGMVYIGDDAKRLVHKCTPEGKIVLSLEIPEICTDISLGPQGEIYINDTTHVYKYTPEGKLLTSWGQPGTSPGEFNDAHNICCDEDGWVYVADRESHRIQVFDGNGKYVTQWNSLHRVQALDQDRSPEKLFYVGEVGPHLRTNRNLPNLGPRVSILSKDGRVLARLGTLTGGNAPDRFVAPHGIAVDSHGDIYLGELSYAIWRHAFPDTEAPEHMRTLRKFVKVA